jgi:hypothetical protein
MYEHVPSLTYLHGIERGAIVADSRPPRFAGGDVARKKKASGPMDAFFNHGKVNVTSKESSRSGTSAAAAGARDVVIVVEDDEDLSKPPVRAIDDEDVLLTRVLARIPGEKHIIFLEQASYLGVGDIGIDHRQKVVEELADLFTRLGFDEKRLQSNVEGLVIVMGKLASCPWFLDNWANFMAAELATVSAA